MNEYSELVWREERADSGLENSKLSKWLHYAKNCPNDVIENIIFELNVELNEREGTLERIEGESGVSGAGTG